MKLNVESLRLPALAASVTFAAAAAFASAPALAQSVGEPQWTKFCTKLNDSEVCTVQFAIVSENGRLVTSVNLLESKGKTNRRIFQVAVPSGRYIPPGVSVRVDGGQESKLPYNLCLPDRCLAEVQLSDGLVNALKGGGELTLTSTNFRAQKNPVKVTLKGFTASYDGPPLKRDEMESRNKQLEEELKKKAQETADKLKKAQEDAKKAATAGN
ncbi:MAG: invasion associated locus B family protein [Ahrensia sp.]|nr:invasion associated locus B family protein [Ahrensia sp.]